MGTAESDLRNAALNEPERQRILNERNSRLLGELTKIAETARDLVADLRDIETKAKIVDQGARQLELRRSFSRVVAHATRWGADNDARFAELDRLTSEDAALDKDWGNAIVRIHNAWDAALLSIRDSTGTKGDKILAVARQAQESLAKVVLESGYVTIPPRAAANLGRLDIGEAMDFNADFRDEIERAEDLKSILTHIKNHARLVDGLVDLDNGKIIRVSRDPRRAARSAALVIGAFVVGLAAVTGLALPIPGNPSFGSDLISGYLLLFLGAIAHLGIDVLKGRHSPDAIDVSDRWGLWLEVKERSILQAMFTLFIGYAGLVWFARSGVQSDSHRIDALTAFFTGYSIDSIIDAWLNRFDLVVANKTEELKGRLTSQPA